MHVVFVAACFAYSIVQYVQIKGLLVTCQHVVAYKLTSTLDFSQADCNPGKNKHFSCNSLMLLV